MDYEAKIKAIREDLAELRCKLKDHENTIDEWEPNQYEGEITQRFDDYLDEQFENNPLTFIRRLNLKGSQLMRENDLARFNEEFATWFNSECRNNGFRDTEAFHEMKEEEDRIIEEINSYIDEWENELIQLEADLEEEEAEIDLPSDMDEEQDPNE